MDPPVNPLLKLILINLMICPKFDFYRLKYFEQEKLLRNMKLEMYVVIQKCKIFKKNRFWHFALKTVVL